MKVIVREDQGVMYDQQTVTDPHRGLTATIRECWILASNLRESAPVPTWTAEPTIHALVVESIRVDPAHQRQGHCKAFLDQCLADPRFEMVVVEGVSNPVLAAALLRWGWEVDTVVMDFYKRRAKS